MNKSQRVIKDSERSARPSDESVLNYNPVYYAEFIAMYLMTVLCSVHVEY
jgi:hypothetical protein